MAAYSEERSLKALDSAHAALTRGKKGATRGGLGDLCAKYRQVKPMLTIALPLIERIPVIGKKVGDAVRFLMSIADMTCPA